MGSDGIARMGKGIGWRSPPGEKNDISKLAEAMTALLHLVNLVSLVNLISLNKRNKTNPSTRYTRMASPAFCLSFFPRPTTGKD
jgi:hypothetical protein